ncbi:MAG: SCO1664 family protein [Acidimicrobiia bacterium]
MFVHADGTPVELPDPDCRLEVSLEVLQHGAVEILGRIPGSSNSAFLSIVTHEGLALSAIFKPGEGEYPLWDFSEGHLYRREIAAFHLSELLQWDLVPATVLRVDQPAGPGSLQHTVTHDPNEHFFTLFEDYAEQFQKFAVFDVLANNADRKGGHCIRALRSDRIVGIDHGLTFHVDPKLRTVIWQFGGEPVPDELLEDVARVLPELPSALAPWISDREAQATIERAVALLETRIFPDAGDDPRRYPWPLI